MSWVKLDDQWMLHPKFANVPDLGQLLWVKGLTYACAYKTGGIVPRGVIKKLTSVRNTKQLERALVDAGLWVEIEDDYRIHDFEKYQMPSGRGSAEVPPDVSAKRAAAGKIGGVRSGESRRPPQSSKQNEAKHEAKFASSEANDLLPNEATPRACAQTRAGDGIGEREQGGAESKSGNGEGAGGGQSGSTAAPPADASLEAQCAAVAAPLSLGRPEAYQLTTDVFCELWEAKYGRQYELDWRSGPYSEIESFRKVARAAVDRGGDRAEEYLRHWFAQFLADKGRNNRLVDERHPARMLSYDINKWEDPKPEKPKQPTAPAAPVELASAATIRQILGNKIPPPRKAAPQPVLQPEASEAKP